MTAFIDWHDDAHKHVNRQIVGFEFALHCRNAVSMRGRAKEAGRALEAACLSRFGTLRPEGQTPMIHGDNGLVFTSRRFRKA